MLKYNVRKPVDWNGFWGKVQLGIGVTLVVLGLYIIINAIFLAT